MSAELTPPSGGPKQLFPPTGPGPTRRLETNDTKSDDQQAQITALQDQMAEITTLLKHLSAAAVAADKTDKTDRTEISDPDLKPASDSDPDPKPAKKPTDSDSDSDPDPKPETTPEKSSTELLSLYLLQAMEPAQHSTTGSRHTTTASLLEAWHNKINPEARKALQASVCSPGPAAAQGLLTYQNEIKAAIAPEKHTVSATTISALTREPEHPRALHTENLIALACASANMKHLKTITRKIRKTGSYDLDDIPGGSITRSESFRRFVPCYRKSDLWWQALLDLIEAFWGSEAAYSEDDLKAETAWRAANLNGNLKGTFSRGEDSAVTLIARENQLYRSREIASRGKTFCTLMDRARNLLAAAGPEITALFLNRLQIKELELDQLSWGQVTNELIKTDRANLDKIKTENYLNAARAGQSQNLLVLTDLPRDNHQKPPPDRHADENIPGATAQDCWNYLYLGACPEGQSCSRNHPGPPGSKTHFLATSDGTCRRFLQGNCERGETCKFKHPDDDGHPGNPRPPGVYTLTACKGEAGEPRVF